MKAMKKVLALGLALAMVVTAVPVTSAEAASAKLPAKKTYYVGKTNTLKLNATKVKKTAWSKTGAAVKLSAKAKKSVKVTAVKAGTSTVKAKVTYTTGKSKTYSCKVTVKNPVITVPETVTVAVNSKESVAATKKAPSTATISYATDKPEIATVDAATGEVTGVKAGTVEITATLTCGTKTVDAKTTVTVKEVILQDVVQTEKRKIEATVAGDTSKLTKDSFKITNTATNAAAVIKSISVDKTKVTVETFTDMDGAKEFSVVLDGITKPFTATDGTVAGVGLTKTEVPADKLTEVKAYTADANGVKLDFFGLTDADNSKGKVTTETTITKGYVDGTSVYLPAVGDTMTAKVTYHTGSYGTDGSETGIIVETFTITAVDPSVVSYKYQITIGGAAPSWKATSFTANTKFKVNETGKLAYFYITEDGGSEISAADYAKYSVETADASKAVIKSALTDSATGVSINGVNAGNTYVLIKKDDKVVATLPIEVLAAPKATSIELNKSSITVMDTKTIDETITASLKDQYGDNINANAGETKIEALSWPSTTTKTAADALATALTTDTTTAAEKATINVAGNDMTTNVYGAYTFKLTMKDADKNAVVRTFIVNVVESATTATSYVMDLPSEVDATITKDTATNDIIVTAKVAEMANGAKIDYYNDAITYTVKDSAGKDIDATLIDDSTDGTIVITVVDNDTTKFEKKLKAGKYYVTMEFANPTDATKTVKVSGSFTVKDTQDTKVGVTFVKNDLTGVASVAAAMIDTDYVKFTYDGIDATVTVKEVNGKITTTTNSIAYVTSVKVYVPITGSTNTVLVEVPVNQTYTNVAALQ